VSGIAMVCSRLRGGIRRTLPQHSHEEGSFKLTGCKLVEIASILIESDNVLVASKASMHVMDEC